MARARLTLTMKVEYETNGVDVVRLQRNLEGIGERAIDEGWLTGGSDADAIAWDIGVTSEPNREI